MILKTPHPLKKFCKEKLSVFMIQFYYDLKSFSLFLFTFTFCMDKLYALKVNQSEDNAI